MQSAQNDDEEAQTVLDSEVERTQLISHVSVAEKSLNTPAKREKKAVNGHRNRKYEMSTKTYESLNQRFHRSAKCRLTR